MNGIIIQTVNSGTWFSLTFVLTVVLVNFIFIQQGLKQNRSFTTMWLVALTGMLFFMIGIYLFPLSLSEISTALLHGTTSRPGEKSILGGILAVPALFLVIYWLREKVSLLDNMAVPLIIGIGLQNIGCLMAGCCYGEPTSLPFGIRYDTHSGVFAHQLLNGLIPNSNNASLSLHPVPLYVLIGCLLIAVFLLKVRRRLRAPFSLLLLAWVMYNFLRFITEFARDPITNHGLGYEVGGFKALQWIVLAFACIALLILGLREYYFRSKPLPAAGTEAGSARMVTFVLFLLTVSWWMRHIIDYTGRVMLFAALLVAIALTGWKLFKTITLPQFRLATLVVMILTTVFMSQKYIPEKENEKVVYTEIGGGFATSHFFNEIGTSSRMSDCDGNIYYGLDNSRYLEYHSYTGGLSYMRCENLDTYKRQKYGVNSFFGTDREHDPMMGDKSWPIFGIQPKYAIDSKWFGVNIGLLAGNFHYADLVHKPSAENKGRTANQLRKLYVLPSGSLRVGPYDTFFFEFAFAEYFPSSSPLMLFKGSCGSGLGKTDGRYLKLGGGSTGLIAELAMPVNEHTFFDANYGFLPSMSDQYSARSTFSVGVHYRFNYKTVSKRPQKDQKANTGK